MSHLNINDVRSEVLFASALQPSDQPTAAQVRAEIRRTVRRLGVSGCIACMAQDFGDTPSRAAARMLWVRSLVADIFAVPPARNVVTARRQTAA
jgi:hypothetical protein